MVARSVSTLAALCLILVLTAGKFIGDDSGAVVGLTGVTVDDNTVTADRAIIASPSAGTNMVTNPTLSSATGWTAGAGWTISGGHATHTPGSADKLTATIPGIVAGTLYKMVVEVTSQSAGTAYFDFGVDCNSDCSPYFVPGTNTYYAGAYADSGTVTIEILPDSDSDIVIDAIYVYADIYAPFSQAELLNTNLSFGLGVLASNTTGGGNVGMGLQALADNTTGNSNDAFGNFALKANTTGNNLVAIGSYSLFSNTTGDGNIGIGYSSAVNTTTGDNNLAIGEYALGANQTGSANIAIGYRAGIFQSNPTGRLIIDAYPRANAAAELTSSILVGQMDATPANQTLTLNAATTVTNKILSSRTTDLGWTVQSAANQACNTTCTSAAVVGFDTTNGIVGPADATADQCLCAGAN